MAAGDFSKPAIGSKLEVQASINGGAADAWHEIAGLSNLDFNSPNVQKTTFDLLNGRSVQRTGSAQPSTLTAQMASNLSSEIFRLLLDAKNEGTSYSFRFSTAPAEELHDSGNGTVAIDAAGACTFASTSGLNFGGDSAGTYAVGHAIQMDAGGLYRIVSITPDTVSAVNGIVTVIKPTNPVLAATFKIVNPMATVTFQGSVTQIGNISAAPSSAVNTDTLEVSAANVITKDLWTFSGV